MNGKLAHYAAAAVLALASLSLYGYQGKLDIPVCDNKYVLATAVALWKMQALKDAQPVQDGRLTNVYEEPIKVASGRSCAADLVVDGKPSGTINFSVLAPLQGGAGMVTLD